MCYHPKAFKTDEARRSIIENHLRWHKKYADEYYLDNAKRYSMEYYGQFPPPPLADLALAHSQPVKLPAELTRLLDTDPELVAIQRSIELA